LDDEVLLRHTGGVDDAAVGMPDRHYGQEILACVIVRDDRRAGSPGDEGALREELRAFCAMHLGGTRRPRRSASSTNFPGAPPARSSA
jgi:acyl-coenzyme A synthetase/AMP-(fatty) acid ligase